MCKFISNIVKDRVLSGKGPLGTLLRGGPALASGLSVKSSEATPTLTQVGPGMTPAGAAFGIIHVGLGFPDMLNELL